MLGSEASSVLRGVSVRTTQTVMTLLWPGWGVGGSEEGRTNFLPLPKPPAPAVPSMSTRGQKRPAGPTPEGPSRLPGALLEQLLRAHVSGLESSWLLLTDLARASKRASKYMFTYLCIK